MEENTFKYLDKEGLEVLVDNINKKFQKNRIQITTGNILELEPGLYWADHNNSCTNKPHNATAFSLDVVKVGKNNKHFIFVSGAHHSTVTNGQIWHYDIDEDHTEQGWYEVPTKKDDLLFKTGYESQTISGGLKPDYIVTKSLAVDSDFRTKTLEVSQTSKFNGNMTASDIGANNVTVKSLKVNSDSTFEGDMTTKNISATTITSTGTVKANDLTITGDEGRIYGNKINITSHKALEFNTNGSAYIFNKTEGKGENLYIGSTTIGLQGSSNNVLSPKAKITANGFQAEGGKSNEVFTRDGGYIEIDNYPTKEETVNIITNNELISSLQTQIIALQDKVTKLSMTPSEYSKEAVGEIKKGGDVTLLKDIKVDSGELLMTKNTDLDLNGHAIDTVGGEYGDALVLGNGANITIKNGIINPSETESVANSSATILVKTSVATKLTLEDVEVSGIHPIYLLNSAEGTEVTIKSGDFTCTGTNGEAIYVQKGGKVVIEGGYFSNPNATDYAGFLLNIKDDLRKGKDPREFIEVKGGTFKNFDPSNNKAEGEGTNFVAEGYHVETENDGNDILYNVVKD